MKPWKVGEVSDQINSNHWAWAQNIQRFETKQQAERYADNRWKELCDSADQAGSNYVGVTVMVKVDGLTFD